MEIEAVFGTAREVLDDRDRVRLRSAPEEMMATAGPARFPESFVAFDAADREQPIHQRFQQQVARTPSLTAVRCAGRDWTYAMLDAQANRAAQSLLRRLGDPGALQLGDPPWPGTRQRTIALLFDQGIESIVWTLAVLKAGLVYVPIDCRLPAGRLATLLEPLRPAAVIAAAGHDALARRIAGRRCPVIQSDAVGVDHADGSALPPDVAVTPADLAYVFHTSGSTGVPKGVCDSHRNVLHNVQRYTNTLGFAPGDRLSLVQSPSFSGTVSTLFGALCNGATVVTFDVATQGLDRLGAWVKSETVTVFHSVPSIFRQLSDPTDRFPAIRVVRIEGDRCFPADVDHFRRHFSAGSTLVNGLAATECGLVSQHFIRHDGWCAGGDPPAPGDFPPMVPLGHAVADVQIRVVDACGIARGTSGEIEVEGEYLAVGYWGDAALTASRFRPGPGAARRYRTGDLGRMLPDGTLVHLGRSDQKVKVGGDFVDTGDIEQLLLTTGYVEHAVVQAHADAAGETRLVAYVVARPRQAGSAAALREFLQARVAPHMVPRSFVFVDALPLTRDGKVDRQRLPPPPSVRPDLSNDCVGAATDDERALVQLWQEVLEIEPVGVTDSFFELGGDSLRAVRFVGRLDRARFPAIDLKALFAATTIRRLLAADPG